MERYGDEVTIIGVPGRDDTAAMQEFVDRHGLGDLPQAVDTDGSLWARYGVSYQPAWVLINQDGDVRVHAGAFSEQGLEEAVADLRAR